MSSKINPKQTFVILTLLVIQNASTSLLARYSRGVLKEKYLNTSVVISGEIIKLIVSIYMIRFHNTESSLNNNPSWNIFNKLFYLIKNIGYSWIPALCYFIQNILVYVALQNLTSAVYACLQQLKIISAAIFSFIILGKRFHIRQWRALFLLCLGGILMEYHTFQLHSKGKLANDDSISNPYIGTIAIFSVVLLSGFTGVLIQKILQNKGINNDSQLSMWDRNFQLSFWSIIIGSIAMIIKDGNELTENGFFYNWSKYTIIIIILLSLGGILVAVIIKYTDVVVKGFASAISLICICIFGSIILGDTLDIIFAIGASITLIASFNYRDDGSTHEASLQSQTNIKDSPQNDVESPLLNETTKK